MQILLNILIGIIFFSFGFIIALFMKDAETFKNKYFEALNFNRQLIEENKFLKDNGDDEYLYN